MSQHWITFPNLDLSFNIDPIAFTLGTVQIKWSSVFIATSVIIGFFLYFKAVSKQNLAPKQIAFVTSATAFFALVGARLVYVVPSNLAAMDQLYYEIGSYPTTGYYNTFYKMIAFWDRDFGGLNLFGGLIFGLIALAVLCKLRQWSMTKYLDSVSFALPAAIAVNSLGYITNQNSFGRHSDSLLAINGDLIEHWVDVLRMNDIARGGTPIGPDVKWVVGRPVSPTPIYEIFGCLAVIAIVCILSKRLLFTGEKFLWSLGLYSLLRAFTENSRIDAVVFWNMRINVMFSVIAVLACAVLIVLIRWQVREGRMRNISLYVDSQKNDGFENDTFTQKVYKGEAADVDPNTTPAVAPDEADSNPDTTPTAAPGEAADVDPNTTSAVALRGEAADTTSAVALRGEAADADPNTTSAVTPDEAGSVPDTTPTAAPGEADRIAPEPESGGKGQVWTADDFGEETQDDNQ